VTKILLEPINYAGWQNCLRLTNGIVDLIATTDVGPRIIRFGFVGERNEFKEFPEQLGKTGGLDWRAYGGHRLWHAPEHKTRTYFPDNFPIQRKLVGAASRRDFPTLHLIQPPEKSTGIQKEILIRLSPSSSRVTVTHRLRNCGRRATKLAPWALSVMDAGGTAIIPLPPRGSHPQHLLPTSTLTLWPYTDLQDRRWTLGTQYILLRQSAEQLPKLNTMIICEAVPYNQATPQKIGAFVPDGWIAYANRNHLFVKKTKLIRNATYPDLGCNMETFTNKDMLEIETLGPLVELKSGKSIEHTEEWSLFRDVPVPHNDEDVELHIVPKL
jgi:hypothetical protein